MLLSSFFLCNKTKCKYTKNIVDRQYVFTMKNINNFCLIKKSKKYKIFFFLSKVVKIGLYLCAQKLSENILKKVDINLEIIKRLVTFVGIKKVLHLRTQDKEIYGL